MIYFPLILVFVLIAVVMLLMPTIVQPNLPFGVRIPDTHAADEVIGDERRAFRVGIVLVSLLTGALTIGFVAETGQRFASFGLFLLLFGGWVVYYRAHRRLQAVKAREGWYAGQRQGVVVQTDLVTSPARVPWIWGLPALAILVLTVAWGIVDYPNMPATLAVHLNSSGTPTRNASKSIWSAFSPVFGQAIVTLLVGILAFVRLPRHELDAERPVRSARQSRIYQQTLFKWLLLLISAINLSLLLECLMLWQVISTSSRLTTLIPLVPVVGVVALIGIMLRVGQGGHRVTVEGGAEPATGLVNRDDDRYWVGGIFYVNRQDPAFFVNKRFGIGWTLNFGNPISWIIIVVLLGVIVLTKRFGAS